MIFIGLFTIRYHRAFSTQSGNCLHEYDTPQGTDGIHDSLLLHLSDTGGTLFGPVQSVATMFACPCLCVSAMVVCNEMDAITSDTVYGLLWASHGALRLMKEAFGLLAITSE